MFWLVQKKYQISTKAVSVLSRLCGFCFVMLLQMLCFNVFWILVCALFLCLRATLRLMRPLIYQVLTIWGLAGVHTDKFGFKHVWEIWCGPYRSHELHHKTKAKILIRLYQVFYGLMICPWYAYSQTLISEVSPLPQMYVRHYRAVLI